MSLIKVENIGFGLSGNQLDLTIAIPRDSYLWSFRVYNQKDIEKDGCSENVGKDYIEMIKNVHGISRTEAFQRLFGAKVTTYTEPSTQVEYDVYSLKNGNYGVDKVSQNDITFIFMQIPDDEVETCDDARLTAPLFNLTPMRLAALDAAKNIKVDCEVPRIFLNKLLQIKAIETALCCEAFCEAAKYWTVFYSENTTKSVKSCGCHG